MEGDEERIWKCCLLKFRGCKFYANQPRFRNINCLQLVVVASPLHLRHTLFEVISCFFCYPLLSYLQVAIYIVTVCLRWKRSDISLSCYLSWPILIIRNYSEFLLFVSRLMAVIRKRRKIQVDFKLGKGRWRPNCRLWQRLKQHKQWRSTNNIKRL